MKLLSRRQSASGRGGKAPPNGPLCSALGNVVHRRRKRTNSGLSTLFSDEDDATLCSQSSGLIPRCDNNLSSCPPIDSPPISVVGGASSSSLKSSLTSSLTSSEASSSSQPTRSSSKRSVRFGKVEIREYHTIISDCLSTAAGPPIGLDWQYDSKATVESDVDAYEVQRDASGPRLRSTALRIPPGERVEMLLACGISPLEVQAAVNKVHDEYQRSYGAYPFHGRYGLLIQEGCEIFKMGVKGIVAPIHSYVKQPGVYQGRID